MFGRLKKCKLYFRKFLTTSVEGRQCYICLEEDGEEAEWVSPCRCSGSIKWVHCRCITRWVIEIEATHPGKTVTCSMCKTKLRLNPEDGPLVTAFEFIDTVANRLIMFKNLVVLGVLMVDKVSTIIERFLQFLQSCGLEETARKIESVTYPDTVQVILQVAVNSIGWERSLLNFLRRGSRLPMGIRCLLPEDVPDRFKLPERISFTRSVVNTILLPFIARFVGNLCFSFVDSQGYRVLYGGLTFLAVKGGCSMYLLHKLEMRRKKIVVTPYRPSIRPSISE